MTPKAAVALAACVVVIHAMIGCASMPQPPQANPIQPYPSRKDVGVVDPRWVEVTALSQDDIASDFSNLKDLSWIEPIARTKRVFLLGETHYFQYISHLRNRILFALNTFDRYPLLVLEDQFSFTPFINHYLDLEDQGQADRFFHETLSDILCTQEQADLVLHIRRWNRVHPAKTIHLGCSDIEHDYARTLRSVVLPYLQQIDPTLRIPADPLQPAVLGELIPKLRHALQGAGGNPPRAAWPFLKPEFIGAVIDNLESTFKAYAPVPADAVLDSEKEVMKEDYDFVFHRQKAILRNLTDFRFLGGLMGNGKFMVYGGERHVPSHVRYPLSWNFLREGSYLSHEYEPTKGRTYSMMTTGLALSLGEMQEVDPGTCLLKGAEYLGIVQRLQRAADVGAVAAKDACLLDPSPPDLLSTLLFAKAYEVNHQPMLLTQVRWPEILNRAAGEEIRSAYLQMQNEVEGFDAWVVVPRSPIIVSRTSQPARP